MKVKFFCILILKKTSFQSGFQLSQPLATLRPYTVTWIYGKRIPLPISSLLQTLHSCCHSTLQMQHIYHKTLPFSLPQIKTQLIILTLFQQVLHKCQCITILYIGQVNTISDTDTVYTLKLENKVL